MAKNVSLTGHERTFSADDVIVTKTDLKGHITYVNRVFLQLAQLDLKQAIGAPHSIIRHPAMPRCVFKLLWDRLAGGHEVFAYVVNRALTATTTGCSPTSRPPMARTTKSSATTPTGESPTGPRSPA